jgi:DNA-binding CsgD family transcriptional regulator
LNVDWVGDAKKKLTALTDEEKVILDMLAENKTQPDIGRALGQHRSMIWRKVQKIKKRLRET